MASPPRPERKGWGAPVVPTGQSTHNVPVAEAARVSKDLQAAENSDGGYDSNENKNGGREAGDSEEERKEFELRKSQLLKTDFDGSDNEPYSASDDENGEEGSLRDDFSLSEDGDSEEEEKRDRAFFGDEEYTMLS